MSQLTNEIINRLEQFSTPEKKLILPRFFKTGKGQYGEGDQFLGVVVPYTRQVAKEYKHIPFQAMAELLQSPWHEARLCALLMLVERFKKSDETERKHIFDFYLTQTAHINNWDLVDLSAPGIVGEYLKLKPEREQRQVLYKLSDSPLLWNQRIAIVSTFTFIKNRDFIDTIILSERFLNRYHSMPKPTMHDLMQKAIGWMLREMGKRDKDMLVQFLEKHATTMPRTMLRYAIEKFSEEERRDFMKR